MYLLCNYHPLFIIPSLTLFFGCCCFFIAHKLPNANDKGLFLCLVPHQNGNMTRVESWPLLHQGLLQWSECYLVHAEDILNTWWGVASDDSFLWPQVKLQGGNSAPPINRKLEKELLGPPIRARPRFHHSQSLPSGSFQKLFILIHQRANRVKTKITEI